MGFSQRSRSAVVAGRESAVALKVLKRMYESASAGRIMFAMVRLTGLVLRRPASQIKVRIMYIMVNAMYCLTQRRPAFSAHIV